jgi:hypothetical protein
VTEHLVGEPVIAVSSLPVWTCVCGHEAARHDPTALRYCRATTSNELRRDCICNVADAQPMSRR